MMILWSMACRALSVTVSDAYTPLDGPKGAVFIVEFMYPAAATWHMKFLHHCLLCHRTFTIYRVWCDVDVFYPS